MTTTTRYNDGFDVGDFLNSSWGYDQTNATFYKVIKRTPQMVTLMKVKRSIVRDDNFNVIGVVPTDEPVMDHESCEASEGLKPLEWMDEWPHHLREHENTEGGLPCFVPVTSRHRIRYGSVRIASYASASPWDGKPEYDTMAAGHLGH